MDWQAARIARAWSMYLRTSQRGDDKAAALWMQEWQRLCNEVIEQTEVIAGWTL